MLSKVTCDIRQVEIILALVVAGHDCRMSLVRAETPSERPELSTVGIHKRPLEFTLILIGMMGVFENGPCFCLPSNTLYESGERGRQSAEEVDRSGFVDQDFCVVGEVGVFDVV